MRFLKNRVMGTCVSFYKGYGNLCEVFKKQGYGNLSEVLKRVMGTCVS